VKVLITGTQGSGSPDSGPFLLFIRSSFLVDYIPKTMIFKLLVALSAAVAIVSAAPQPVKRFDPLPVRSVHNSLYVS